MVLFRGAVFAAATASKAWEPLAVAVAGAGDTPYLFATALVLCEMGKLLLLLPFLALSPPTRHSRVSWFASATHYGVPALLLAVCNLCLGYAVPRLGALLYQIVFQVTTVFATGFAAAALLGQRLAAGQWAALALLTLGSLGASRSRLGSGRITNAPPSADGLVAALVGSVALSLSTVLSERTASTAGGALASRSVLHQAALMSAWGVAATAALLCVLHGPALLAGDASASPLAGFGAVAPWVVVGSIAAADLSMTVFCMVDGLGANAYSVSRCLAMVASPPLAALALDTRVSPGFAAASTVVAVGSYLFARYQPPVREDRQTYGRVLQDPHPESPGGVTK